jgi:hypothetical protein
MTKAEQSAFPTEQGTDPNGCWNQTWEPGMTMREYFASMALTAAEKRTRNLTFIGWDMEARLIAECALRIADALIAELNKEKE